MYNVNIDPRTLRPIITQRIMLLTLHQPWSTLMAVGLKRFETRSWRTPWSGLVAIHAGMNTAAMRDQETINQLHSHIMRAFPMIPPGWHNADAVPERSISHIGYYAPALPLGVIVSVGRLIACERTEDVLPAIAGTDEERLGNYDRNRYAWHFVEMVALRTPILYRGVQGLRDIPPGAVRDELRAQWDARATAHVSAVQ